MENVSQIIHAKWIIPGGEYHAELEDHAMAIQDGVIKQIMPSSEISQHYTAKTTIHYPTHAIIPGLINSHTHIGMAYFRGLADDLALMDWLQNYIWPMEKKWVSHDFVRDASLFAMAEMIRGGITCFNDMYFFLQATAEAADMAGLRAHIGITVLDFPTNWAQTTDEYFTRGLEFYQQYKNHSRITTSLAPHAPYTVSDQTLLRAKEIAEMHDLKINLHLHESADEIKQSLASINKRPIRRLHDIGLISPRLIAIHMTQIDDEDLGILEACKPNIVHCPESNMKLANGISPVQKFKSRGLNVALGTDSVSSNNDLNMLGEMRTAALLAKLATGDATALPAEEALQLATLNGAKALGIDHLTGSLSAGKAADFAVINLEQIETLPVYHPTSQIVYAAGRHQVTDVWVAGKQLMKDRKLLTIDESELINKAKYWNSQIKT